MSLGGDRLQVLCPDRVQDPFSRGWLPRGNLQYNGVSLPPPCPVGLAGVAGFPQPYRFGTLCLGLLDPFGGWVLGGLPFPTGRFWDGLGPGLSRLPPLQLLINCPLSIFCLQADNGVARSMAMNVAYRMRRGLGCLVPSSSLV